MAFLLWGHLQKPPKGICSFNVVRVLISPNQIRIVQRMSLTGDQAHEFAESMRVFETSAPQGLAKLAKAIAAADQSTS